MSTAPPVSLDSAGPPLPDTEDLGRRELLRVLNRVDGSNGSIVDEIVIRVGLDIIHGRSLPGDDLNSVELARSFGSSRTLATGVPLRVNLTVTEAAKDYAPLAGAAVYLWHCDRLGRYSMYTSGAEDENYLRGIARTGSDGTAPAPMCKSEPPLSVNAFSNSPSVIISPQSDPRPTHAAPPPSKSHRQRPA